MLEARRLLGEEGAHALGAVLASRRPVSLSRERGLDGLVLGPVEGERRPSACTSAAPRSAAPRASCAISIATSSASPFGTTRLTRPQASAVSTGSGSPKNIISLARPSPMRRVTRMVPPLPGNTPSLISGSATRAAVLRHDQVAAHRELEPAAEGEAVETPRSSASGSRRPGSRPRSRARASSARRRRPPSSAGNSLMSEPAQNAFSPVPVSTRTRTAASSASRVDGVVELAASSRG